MQAETTVYPARRHDPELRPLRIRQPEIGDHRLVVGRDAEQLVGEPRVGGVADEQDGQREAEHDA
jgi:hypothetical protein